MSDDPTPTDPTTDDVVTGDADHGYKTVDDLITEIDVEERAKQEAKQKVQRDLPQNAGQLPPADLAPVLGKLESEYNSHLQQKAAEHQNALSRYRDMRIHLQELDESEDYLDDHLYDDRLVIRTFIGYDAEIPPDDPDSDEPGEREDLLAKHRKRIADVKEERNSLEETIEQLTYIRYTYRHAVSIVQRHKQSATELLDGNGGGGSGSGGNPPHTGDQRQTPSEPPRHLDENTAHQQNPQSGAQPGGDAAPESGLVDDLMTQQREQHATEERYTGPTPPPSETDDEPTK